MRFEGTPRQFDSQCQADMKRKATYLGFPKTFDNFLELVPKIRYFRILIPTPAG